MRNGLMLSAAILMGATLANSALAAGEGGEELYMDACATCHGAAGMGEGPMAEFMTAYSGVSAHPFRQHAPTCSGAFAHL
jgi:mono/diheme cytochrome c family protein